MQRGIYILDEALSNIINNYIHDKGVVTSHIPFYEGRNVPYSIFAAPLEYPFVQAKLQREQEEKLQRERQRLLRDEARRIRNNERRAREEEQRIYMKAERVAYIEAQNNNNILNPLFFY